MPVLRRPPLCCATMGSALASERPAAEDRLAPQNRSLGTCNGQCGMHECCEALQEPRPLKAQDSSSHAASVMLQRVNGMTAGMCHHALELAASVCMHECCEALQEPRPLKAQDSSSHTTPVMLQRVNGMAAGMCHHALELAASLCVVLANADGMGCACFAHL